MTRFMVVNETNDEFGDFIEKIVYAENEAEASKKGKLAGCNVYEVYNYDEYLKKEFDEMDY